MCEAVQAGEERLPKGHLLQRILPEKSVQCYGAEEVQQRQGHSDSHYEHDYEVKGPREPCLLRKQNHQQGQLRGNERCGIAGGLRRRVPIQLQFRRQGPCQI